MEGVAGFAFNYKKQLLRASPPLNAIDRFLCSQNSEFAQNQTIKNVKNNEMIGCSHGFHGFSASRGVMCDFESDSCLISHGDRSFIEGECLRQTNEINDRLCLNWEMKLREKTKLGKQKRLKSRSSATLIKGQWTDQEDRLLIKLVEQHGVKTWALIAQNMVGRAGKQCRERWHNHLRPNIKKDSWSEEEERQFIEAHEKFGNRWAEIAKHIPGRSENAIKNHWNATKRRQDSRRKYKKLTLQGGDSSPTSILQEYIRSKCIGDSSSPTMASTPSTNLSTQYSFSPSEPSDDDLLFMGGLLNNCEQEVEHLQSPNIFGSTDFYTSAYDNPSIDMSYTSYFTATPAKETQENIIQEDVNKASLAHSDMYISYLFEGVAAPSYDPSENNSGSSSSFNLPMDQPSDLRNEMDLIEMIASSQCSQRVSQATLTDEMSLTEVFH